MQIPQVFYLFGTQFQVYNVVISAAVVTVILPIIVRAPRGERRAALDMCLLALAMALLLARVEHVALRWDYYAEHLDQALDIRRGGLGWHGTLLGAWVVVRGYGRLRRGRISGNPSTPSPFSMREKGDQKTLEAPRPDARAERLGVRVTQQASLYTLLALALIFLTAAAWVGCAAAGCAYGAEVRTLADYPPGVTAELRDVYGIVAPRWNTPLYGVVLAGVMAGVAGLSMWTFGRTTQALQTTQASSLQHDMTRTVHHAPRTFSIVLAILAFGMFVIGYARADAVVMLGGVRGDQVLDAATLIVAVWMVIVRERKLT